MSSPEKMTSAERRRWRRAFEFALAASGVFLPGHNPVPVWAADYADRVVNAYRSRGVKP